MFNRDLHHCMRTPAGAVFATALLIAVCVYSIPAAADQSGSRQANRRQQTQPTQQTRKPPVDGAFSSVAGTVSDSLGGPLSGVQVTLVSDASGDMHSATTAPDATFEIANLPAGRYSLQLSRAGFARSYLDLELDDNERSTQTLAMQVDDVKETMRIVIGRETAPPAPARPPAMRQKESSPVRFCAADGSGCVTPAQKVGEVRPLYPTVASARGIEGIVIAEAVIDEQGSIGEVRVLRSADEQIDAAVVEAVRQWQFIPTLLNGTPTPSLLNLTVEFVIASR